MIEARDPARRLPSLHGDLQLGTAQSRGESSSPSNHGRFTNLPELSYQAWPRMQSPSSTPSIHHSTRLGRSFSETRFRSMHVYTARERAPQAATGRAILDSGAPGVRVVHAGVVVARRPSATVSRRCVWSIFRLKWPQQFQLYCSHSPLLSQYAVSSMDHGSTGFGRGRLRMPDDFRLAGAKPRSRLARRPYFAASRRPRHIEAALACLLAAGGSAPRLALQPMREDPTAPRPSLRGASTWTGVRLLVPS